MNIDRQKIRYSLAEREELERANPDYAIEWCEMTRVGGPPTFTILSVSPIRRVSFGDTFGSDGAGKEFQ